jgi:hypothetical protein
MRFRFTEEQEKLRREIADYFREEIRGELLEWVDRQYERGISVPESPEFTEKLVKKGWLGLQYSHGVQEGSIFEEESGYWRAPVAYHNERIVGAIIQSVGSDEQKEYFLPRLANGEITIALGYSEPGCGSDLAALTTRAVQDGDEYVINGQKTYSSRGLSANHAIVAARTNTEVPKHKGISLILVPLDVPGVTVRSLPMMGWGIDTAELFFDDVRVSTLNLIGERDLGWYYLAASLDFQRVRIGEVGVQRRIMEELVEFVNETKVDGEPLSKDPFVRDMLAERAIEVEVARLFNYRSVWAATRGPVPSHYTSMGTMYLRETSQRLAQTATEILGLYAPLKWDSKWAQLKGSAEALYRAAPGFTLAGGTSEIQRNVVAQRGLGLPR